MSETMSENEQLERILSSAQMVTSPSLSRFLRYIVEETLAGRSAAIREYSLGVAVFDRGDDFNPRLDPIVRVQARNLRARMARYYEGPGVDDPIRIELPKGTYVPVFHKQAVQPPPAEPPIPAEAAPVEEIAPVIGGPVMPVPPPRSPVAEPRMQRYWLAAILLLLILIGIATLVLTQSNLTAHVSRTVARAIEPWGILGG